MNFRFWRYDNYFLLNGENGKEMVDLDIYIIKENIERERQRRGDTEIDRRAHKDKNRCQTKPDTRERQRNKACSYSITPLNVENIE